MSDRYRDQSWSIVPGTYPVRADDDCVTLDLPVVDAAVQISAYRKATGNVTFEELDDFADRKGHGERPTPASFGDFRGYAVEYEDAGIQWRCWWLGCGSLHLFVTHTAGSVAELETTRADVDRILGSLRFESVSPAV